MAPPAPGLLSTTTGTPTCLLSWSASKRMLMSLPPPAGHATINVIGSEGNVCACKPGAVAPITPAATPMAANVSSALRIISRLPRLDLTATAVGQQELCHELSHDIEREQRVFRAAEEAEHRLIQSGGDEILQPLGAMLRRSRDGEGFDRVIGHERGGRGDVAAGNSGDHRLLIDRDARVLD